MSGPMVRAILEGRKTQTRRMVKGKPQPWDGKDSLQECKTVERDGTGHGFIFWRNGLGDSEFTKLAYPEGGWQCPYGKPGDRLWVRETCSVHSMGNVVAYRADHPDAKDIRWRPSIHMPRWASRILLEITNARVERVQDITEVDAMAEGAPREDCWSSYRQSFEALWCRTYGPQSWSWNLWVWVVEFRRIEA